MKQKATAVIMTLVLAFTLSVPAFAVDYSDLEGHWAQTYMKDLAERGYLSGYDDGTMRPDVSMTACETLVILSRMYTLTDTVSGMIQADYKDAVDEALPASLSWAQNYLAVCLAAGIITESELGSIDLTAAIQKQQLAVFLVRAMQLTTAAAALSSSTLSFADASLITASCRGSIAELVAIEILKGDNTNYLYPKSSVTRAVVATMLSRALDYLDAKDVTLGISAYTGLAQTKGIITDVSGSAVDILGFDGLTREYTVASGAAVTVNGAAKTISSLYDGCYAQITLNGGAVSKLEIESDSAVQWVSGCVSSSYYSINYSYIFVTSLDTGTNTEYTVADNVATTLEGTSIDFADLPNDTFVVLKLEGNTATEVSAVAGEYELSGEITSIKYGTTVTLKLKDAAGTRYSYQFAISDMPEITRGSTQITIDRLNVGNEVKLTAKSCIVESILASGAEVTVTGELTSTSTTKDGTVWVITKDDGSAVTLTLDENAGVYNGNTAILLSSVQVGDRISVVVYDNTITEISLQSVASTAAKVSGTVLTVDISGKVITLLTSSDKLVYIDASYYYTMIRASTGYSLSLAGVGEGDLLVAYGSYTDAANFKAVTILIES